MRETLRKYQYIYINDTTLVRFFIGGAMSLSGKSGGALSSGLELGSSCLRVLLRVFSNKALPMTSDVFSIWECRPPMPAVVRLGRSIFDQSQSKK